MVLRFLAVDALTHVDVSISSNTNIITPSQGVEYGFRSLQERDTIHGAASTLPLAGEHNYSVVVYDLTCVHASAFEVVSIAN